MPKKPAKTQKTTKKTAKTISKSKTPAKKVAPKKTAKAATPDKDKAAAPKPKSKKGYDLLRGMHDILPKEEKYWKPYYHKAEELAEHFRFKRIETPVLEVANLFIRSLGRGTEVIDKEMYVFEDKDKVKVALRPEMTASTVRAYIGHGMWNLTQPVKLWYWAPMFRHDRPQAGRYRQFWQVGYESFGSDDPVVDAEMVLVAYSFYKDFGLPVEVHINSIGTPEERERYRAALTDYYRSRRSYLPEEYRSKITKNPLRILDAKDERCLQVNEEAPQIIDWLESSSKAHLMKVLEYLDELEIPYVLRPTLVRGLDYYTHTVFEIYPAEAELKSQSALAGGGRYDLLVETLGGKPTPAAGFSMGIERSISYMKQYYQEHESKLPKQKFDVFVAQLGEQARLRALKLISNLRASGIRIDFNFCKQSLKNQLEIADSLNVPYALILGQKEVQDSTIIIRDMESGVQEIVDQQKVEKVLKKKLEKFD